MESKKQTGFSLDDLKATDILATLHSLQKQMVWEDSAKQQRFIQTCSGLCDVGCPKNDWTCVQTQCRQLCQIGGTGYLTTEQVTDKQQEESKSGLDMQKIYEYEEKTVKNKLKPQELKEIKHSAADNSIGLGMPSLAQGQPTLQQMNDHQDLTYIPLLLASLLLTFFVFLIGVLIFNVPDSKERARILAQRERKMQKKRSPVMDQNNWKKVDHNDEEEGRQFDDQFYKKL